MVTITPQRGLRQGDPLSPYLFIMALNILIRNIEMNITNKNIDGLRASRNGSVIPALAFADDCIIFSSAKPSSTLCLKKLIDDFCLFSGQSLNTSKSSIYYAPSTIKYHRRQTKSILGIKKNKTHEKYLGLPIINGRVTKNLFNSIITKMNLKLNVWYNKYLSLAGRTVLINSTLQTIPYYAMAAFNLPIGVKHGIQKTMKHYFWNTTNSSNRKAKAPWSLISSLKMQGGLGIKDVNTMNKAFQMKIIWKLLVDNNSLFSKVLKAKYYPHSSILNTSKKAC